MLSKKEEKTAAEIEAIVSGWPLQRDTKEQMTSEEQEALKSAEKVWPIGKKLLSKDRKWTKEKGTDQVQVFSGKSEDLKMNVFKVKVHFFRSTVH